MATVGWPSQDMLKAGSAGLLLIVFFVAGPGASGAGKNQARVEDGKQVSEVKDVPDCVLKLGKAPTFDSKAVGEGSPSQWFAFYCQARDARPLIPLPAIDWLLKNGTPAGRLYAAMLFWERDFQTGRSKLKLLSADGARVSYKSGCEVFPTTVKEVAASFLQKDSYLDFPSSRFCERPIGGAAQDLPNARRQLPDCLSKLMTAANFEDGVAGESGLGESFKDYRDAREKIEALSVRDLEWLEQKASPAGRLYAAVLLRESGQAGGEQSFGRLIGDMSEVVYLSGCKGCKVTVDEIARSFMKESKFHNFRLSIFCKLKGPKSQ